jgi:hypothetical protein
MAARNGWHELAGHNRTMQLFLASTRLECLARIIGIEEDADRIGRELLRNVALHPKPPAILFANHAVPCQALDRMQVESADGGRSGFGKADVGDCRLSQNERSWNVGSGRKAKMAVNASDHLSIGGSGDVDPPWSGAR